MTIELNQAISNVRRYMDAALSVGHTASQYRLTDGSISFLFHGDLDVILAALPAPPADDVHQALTKLLFEDDALYPLDDDGEYRLDVQTAVEAILMAFDVRPRNLLGEVQQ